MRAELLAQRSAPASASHLPVRSEAWNGAGPPAGWLEWGAPAAGGQPAEPAQPARQLALQPAVQPVQPPAAEPTFSADALHGTPVAHSPLQHPATADTSTLRKFSTDFNAETAEPPSRFTSVYDAVPPGPSAELSKGRHAAHQPIVAVHAATAPSAGALNPFAIEPRSHHPLGKQIAPSPTAARPLNSAPKAVPERAPPSAATPEHVKHVYDFFATERAGAGGQLVSGLQADALDFSEAMHGRRPPPLGRIFDRVDAAVFDARPEHQVMPPASHRAVHTAHVENPHGAHGAMAAPASIDVHGPGGGDDGESQVHIAGNFLVYADEAPSFSLTQLDIERMSM